MYQSLHNLVDMFRKFQEANNDVVAMITGPKGVGKTSLAIQAMRIYLSKYMGINSFNIKKYIAFDNKDLVAKIHDLPPYSPILADEAARFAMGEDWNKPESKELKKLIAQIRPKRLIILMCIPRFRWIDSKYRNDMVTYWIRLVSRGKGFVFQPDLSEVDDAWHLQEMNKETGFYSYFPNYEKLARSLRRHICYADNVLYPEVDKEIYAKYEIIRNAKVFERTEVSVDQRDVGKLMVYNIRKRWDELVGHKKPSNDMITKLLLTNPKTKQALIGPAQVAKWDRQVKEVMGEGNKMDTQKVPESA